MPERPDDLARPGDRAIATHPPGREEVVPSTTDHASTGPPRPVAVVAEPRQRWRVTYARAPVSSERVGRAALDEWQVSLAGSGLPVAIADSETRRPRVAFAAPLPAAAHGDRELVDVWLAERVPAWRVREALVRSLPPDHDWVSAEDVWLGEPALPGLIVAAEWRVTAASTADALEALRPAARDLLAAPTILRSRIKGGIEKPVDIRPFIERVDVVRAGGSDSPAPAAVIHMRLRTDPERGTGRPDDVIAALETQAGARLQVEEMRRLGFVLAPPARSRPPERPSVRRARRPD